MRVAFVVVAVFAPAAAAADTYTITPADDLYARLADLEAGDTVIVRAGSYQTPGLLNLSWNGTAGQPVVVRAADGERPILRGTPSQNVLDLSGSYFTLRGFEIVNGSHGVRLGTVDHATLEDLRLHELGDVGISCNRPGQGCRSLILRRNEIYATGMAATGEGMYLGCNDGECTFADAIVEGNYIHDLGGSQGDGIEVKTGAVGVIVRDNVIIRARYPGITMYGFAGAGTLNVVERNLVWGTVDNGIQTVGQIIVRNNLVIAAGANGIHSKPSQGATPRDVSIVHNTVVAAGAACLKTNDWTGQSNQIIANNALYCPGGTALELNGGAPAAVLAGNVVLGDAPPTGVIAGTSVAADLGDASSGALYPPSGSKLINAGSAAHAVPQDFNGTARSDALPDVGAYERSAASNPGWLPREGFKVTPTTPGPVDAGPAPLDARLADAPVTPRDAAPDAVIRDAGSAGAASADAAPPGASGDEGCGCRSAPSTPSGLVTFALGLVIVLARVLRRRAAGHAILVRPRRPPPAAWRCRS